MRLYITSVALIVLIISPACSASTTVPFYWHYIKTPRHIDPLFIHTWPYLIQETNNSVLNKSLNIRPTRGHNLEIDLDIATIPIRDGTATISVLSPSTYKCDPNPLGENHNNLPVPLLCPARMTIKNMNTYKSYNIGKICVNGLEKDGNRDFVKYNEYNNTISIYAKINNKRVEFNVFNENCDKIINIPK